MVASNAIAATLQVIPGTSYFLTYSVEGSAASKGAFNPDKVQKLSVKIVDKEGNPASGNFTLKGFDARMPAHNHGMITKPVVKKVSDSEFTVEGVKLHMTGAWILDFKLAGVSNGAPAEKSGVEKSVKVPVEIK